MRIRRADLADAAGIAVVHVASSRAAYPEAPPPGEDAVDRRRAVWERILAGARWPRAATLVADGDDGIVGFADLCPDRDPDADPRTDGEITAVYVLPACWGTGVGTLLMTAAVETLGAAGYRRATLWVLETNQRARRFYAAHGWLPDAVKRDTTRDVPRTVVRYRRTLGPPGPQ